MVSEINPIPSNLLVPTKINGLAPKPTVVLHQVEMGQNVAKFGSLLRRDLRFSKTGLKNAFLDRPDDCLLNLGYTTRVDF